MFTASTFTSFIGCKGKEKWFKTAGVFCKILKGPALREEIGDHMDMYSINHDNSPI